MSFFIPRMRGFERDSSVHVLGPQPRRKRDPPEAQSVSPVLIQMLQVRALMQQRNAISSTTRCPHLQGICSILTVLATQEAVIGFLSINWQPNIVHVGKDRFSKAVQM